MDNIQTIVATFIPSLVGGPYNVALAIAIGTGLWLAVRAGRQADLPALPWHVLLGATLAAGLIGSKFVFLDFHAPEAGEKSNLGALIVGSATALILARWFRLGALRSLDTISVPTLAGMAIGRVGCFLAGCCAGTETSLPWGVVAKGDTHATHPVQLYEAALDVLVIGALSRWVPIRTPGQRFSAAVLLYAGVRFGTEFVRADRTIVAGLNPVQWSLIAIASAVALWHWSRARRAPSPPSTLAADVATMRAVPTAMIAMVALFVVTLGADAEFTSLERTLLLMMSGTLGLLALLPRTPRWIRRPLVPSLGALALFHVPTDSVTREREVLVGGRMWSGVYSVIAGQVSTPYTDACTGGTSYNTERTYARRRTTTGLFSAGYRERRASGTRVTIEGELLSGADRLKELEAGTVYEPVREKTSIRAGGARLTLEGRNQHLQVNAMGGRTSDAGRSANQVVGSLLVRTGVERGFFLEGNATAPGWYSTTGEISYLGLGHVLSSDGARLVIGIGTGLYGGLHVPINGFEVDLIGRSPGGVGDIERPQPTVSLGVKRGFRIR